MTDAAREALGLQVSFDGVFATIFLDEIKRGVISHVAFANGCADSGEINERVLLATNRLVAESTSVWPDDGQLTPLQGRSALLVRQHTRRSHPQSRESLDGLRGMQG